MNLREIFKADRRERALDMVAEALEAGAIYNVDYQELKQSVNRALEHGWRAAIDRPYLDLPVLQDGYGDRDCPEDVSDLYGNRPEIHTLNARDKFVAKLEKGPNADHWLVTTAREYLETIRPLVEDMNRIKATVIKGRKPSTTPRKTPERTLENTGTCPVCEQNCKRDGAGNMVDHGFRIAWNERHGRCYGVGEPPIEVSVRGAEKFLIIVRNTVEVAEEQLRELAKVPAEERDDKWRRNQWNAESTARHAEHDVRKFEKVVAEWAPRPLPDAK